MDSKIVLSLIFLIVSISATSSISSNETFLVTDSSVNDNGQCVCQILAPATITCTEFSSSESLQRVEVIRSQVTALGVQVNLQVQSFRSVETELNELSQQMIIMFNTLERIEEGELVLSRPEITQIRIEISDMEAMLLVLKKNHTAKAVVTQLEAEIANITLLLNELEQQENADAKALLSEIENLKTRLNDCMNEQTDDGLFKPWDDNNLQDSCAPLVSVSQPFTVRGLGTGKGVWFRDPVVSTQRVYYFPIANSRHQYTISTFPSVTAFHNGGTPIDYRLPESAQGPGMVAYNGSLYYEIYNSNYIARYDVTLQQQVIKVPLPNAGINNQQNYRAGHYTDIDFAVDENGLWVIYSTSQANGFIVVSKLDPVTLEILTTWRTNYPKSAVGNCFIACRVLYCNNGFNSHINKFNYRFNMTTSEEGFTDIPFDNKFLNTISLDYNPLDQKLYGWDNGHQVVYDLTFQT